MVRIGAQTVLVHNTSPPLISGLSPVPRLLCVPCKDPLAHAGACDVTRDEATSGKDNSTIESQTTESSRNV